MRKAIILGCLVPFSGCSVPLEDFEAFCRDNYRVTVHDSQQWERYTAKLTEDARDRGEPVRLDDSAPFELYGEGGGEPSLLFPEPVPVNYRVMLDDQPIATINDFTAEVSGLPGVTSGCERFARHALRNE